MPACVFQKGHNVFSGSRFLVTSKRSVCCSFLPHPLALLPPVCSTPTGRREETKSPLPVHTAGILHTMEQEEPGNCKECEGKIKGSLLPIKGSPLLLMPACHFPTPPLPICPSLNLVCLFSFHILFSKRIKLVHFLLSQIHPVF